MSDNYITAAELTVDQKHILQIAAGLLKSYKILIKDGSKFYQDTLDAINALPAELYDSFMELVDWVFEYDQASDVELESGRSTFNWRDKYPWKKIRSSKL